MVRLLVGGIIALVGLNLAWRWASRRVALPCPSSLAWLLEGPTAVFTETQLARMDLRPGQRVLEVGPGPGRLLIPAARRVLPGGEVVGLELQRAMAERLENRAASEGIDNYSIVLGDAQEAHFEPESFDVVFMVTVLGEIPDREAALRHCHRALKPGGLFHNTEIVGDPHYQRKDEVVRLAESVGFRFRKVQGPWWHFTATFSKEQAPTR
jgi:ubiquinone/menaquinone biosynthesis C-methylase UbiE